MIQINATVISPQHAILDGETITTGEGSSIYAAMAFRAAPLAARSGGFVQLNTHDELSGSTYQIVIDDKGKPHQPTGEPPHGTQALYPADAASAVSGSCATNAGLPHNFIREAKPKPRSGWRSALFKVSGGAINPGRSPRDTDLNHKLDGVRSRASEPAVVAVMCLKGGIGKTSTTAGVGLTLARHRGDRVIALDANPDAGDLYERTCAGGAPATLTDLADHVTEIHGMTDLARYTGIAERLSVIAGDQEPTISESLSADDFVAALRAVQRYYNVILVDCGTGVTHPSMLGILSNAHAVVVAGGYAVSGARRAESTLRWLHQNGYQHLARNATVVLTQTATVSSVVDKNAIEAALGQLSATVVTVPHDQAVADGAIINLDDLHDSTRDAYLTVAAALASSFR